MEFDCNAEWDASEWENAEGDAAESDGAEWEKLGECDSVPELDAVRGALESAGIPCKCPALDWHDPRLRRIPAVYVRPQDLAGARSVVDAALEAGAETSGSDGNES